MKITNKWLEENIDPGMRYAIKVLNEKGYPTAYCCEGHYTEHYDCYFGAYISFRTNLPNELFPKLPSFPWREDTKTWSRYKTPITEIGGGYKQNSNKEYEHVFYWTGTRYKSVSREEKDKEHEQFLLELNAWVDSLPSKSDTEKRERTQVNYESPIYAEKASTVFPFKIVVEESFDGELHKVTVKRIEYKDRGMLEEREVHILSSSFWRE